MALQLSTTGASLQKDVIPLVAKIDEDDYTYVTLKNQVIVAGNAEKRQAEVPKVMSEDVELIIRSIRDFDDAVSDRNLDCANDGPKLFRFFRQTLGGEIRDEWDIARAGQANTHAGFQAAVDVYLARFILPTDLADQKRYLETAKKPFKLSVNALATRLRTINQMMAFFPGAADTEPFDEQGLKMLLYNMMLDDWKLAFLASGTDITNPAFTFLALAHYMTVQELAYNAARKVKKQGGSRRNKRRRDDRGPSPSRGRSSSRGGGRSGNHGSSSGGNRNSNGNCPFHEGHDWDQCFGNPQSPNYRPDYRLPAARVGNHQRSNSRNQRGGGQGNRRGYRNARSGRGVEAHAIGTNGSNGSNNTDNSNAQATDGNNAGGTGRGSRSGTSDGAGNAEVHWLDQLHV